VQCAIKCARSRSAFSVVWLVLFVSTLSTAQSAKAIGKPSSELGTGDYSKDAVIFEHYSTKVVYQADATGTREITAVVRMQAEAGVHNFAVLTFPYASTNESVDVEYVRVRKPDGSMVLTPAYNIQDLPAEVTRVAPIYTDVYEKHVTVKALGVGDVLEYLVRYRTIKSQIPGHFWFQYTFSKGIIVKDEELEIDVPRNNYVKVSSPDLMPQVTDNGARRIYAWKTANFQREEHETPAPKRDAPQPSVQITTFRSWEEVGHWYGELQQSQLTVTAGIRTKALELTKGLTDDDAKIRALYHFVSTHFHYISLSFGIGRYQPHAADDVLGNEYGDCKDKHTLLAALLKAAGYDAWPALINSSRKIDPDMPSPGQFDHVVTVVPRGNSRVWLDTTPGVAPFGMLLVNLRDQQTLVIPSNKTAYLMNTPEQPPFASSVTFSTEGTLSPEGTLTAHVRRTIRGDVEILFRLGFRSTPPSQWKDLVQQISYNSGFGGDVSSVTASAPEDTDKAFEFAYDYTRKDYSEWESRRITPPLPPFEIAGTGDEQRPTEPILLGVPGEVVYSAKLALPPGYAPHPLPGNVDMTEDFAEYHATYSIQKGVLTAVRSLVVKNREVPMSAWDNYRKFRKAITDDANRGIDLDYTSKEGGATEPNLEADRKMQEGVDALNGRDITTAQEAFRHVLQIDPDHRGAHGLLGQTYLEMNNIDAGLEELRKEQELYPRAAKSYKVLAPLLAFLHRDDEAIDQWRKLARLDPENRDAAVNLSQMLLAAHRYSEAIDELERAVTLATNSPSLHLMLGDAYLKTGQKEKGISALQQAARIDSGPETLNRAAYSLAEANTGLEEAKKYAEKAVQDLQAASVEAASGDGGFATTTHIVAAWDTLGWVYFRTGDLGKAIRYLRASWNVSQSDVSGDHLAQLYERQGNRSEAAHLYLLALATPGRDKDEIRVRYEHLTGKKASDLNLQTSLRRPDGSFTPTPGEELSRMRTLRVTNANHDSGSAVFSVVFSPGKVEIKYVRGARSLESLISRFAFAKLNVEFPDAGPAKLVRSGILRCTNMGCDFVLLAQDGNVVENERELNAR